MTTNYNTLKNRTALKDNRFERLFIWFKNHKMLSFVCVCLLFLSMEILSISIIYTNEKIRGRNPRYLLSRFVLTRLFIPRNSTFLDGLKQEFIGDLNPTNGKWRKFLPPDSILCWRNAKNIAATHYDTYLYVTNEQGFMSTGKNEFYYPREKEKNALRIIVIGGSTVMGQGAFTPEENLPAQIEKYCKKIQPSTEVINAGVGGYSSSQELLYLMSELVYYEPDIVIVYDGWNDQSYNNLMITKYGKNIIPLKTVSHYQSESRLKDSYNVGGSAILFVSAIGDALRQKVENLASLELIRRLFARFANMVSSRNETKNQKYDPVSVKMYKENLQKMILLSRYHGFKIALFLQPIMGVDNKKLTGEERQMYKNISDLKVRKLFYSDARSVFTSLKNEYANDRYICIGDLSQAFEDLSQRFWADSGHLLLKGNEIIAERITTMLNDCEFVK